MYDRLLCVCVCVCVCVCIYVYMCVYMYVYLCVCIYVYVCICTYVCTYILLKVLFLSNLDTQYGARTHNPEVKKLHAPRTETARHLLYLYLLVTYCQFPYKFFFFLKNKQETIDDLFGG